ncbi:hypothetical protein Taro_000314, partial [Colocasia esculenta]|nr:hypothetical protein [Colocasia esculenta]
ISGLVEEGHKERQDDVDSEESIDNVVRDGKPSSRVLQESKLEWRHPSRIDDQQDQKWVYK